MTYLEIRFNLSWYTTVPVGKFASFCNKLSTSKNLLVIKLMFSKFRGRAYSIFSAHPSVQWFHNDKMDFFYRQNILQILFFQFWDVEMETMEGRGNQSYSFQLLWMTYIVQHFWRRTSYTLGTHAYSKAKKIILLVPKMPVRNKSSPKRSQKKFFINLIDFLGHVYT